MFVFYGKSISELDRVDDIQSPLTLNDLLVVSQLLNGVDTTQALTIQQLRDKLFQEIDLATMGATGAPGERGATGIAGQRGVPGNPGATGPMGPVGATGSTGETGSTGPRGFFGATGSTGPVGPSGAADRYDTTSTSYLTIGTGFKTLNVAI